MANRFNINYDRHLIYSHTFTDDGNYSQNPFYYEDWKNFKSIKQKRIKKEEPKLSRKEIEEMNRRSARTNTDILEVFSVWLDVVREFAESSNTMLEDKSILIIPGSVPSNDYLMETNRRLALMESDCVVIPNSLTEGRVNATRVGVVEEEATVIEKRIRKALSDIAVARTTLYNHTSQDIEKMSRRDLETLRKRVCSTEHHGVAFSSKCLYFLSGTNPKYQLDPETMEVVKSHNIIEKVAYTQNQYKINFSPDNKEGAALSKRIMELRELIQTEKEKNDKEEELELAKTNQYIQEHVDVVQKDEDLKTRKSRKTIATKAKTKTKTKSYSDKSNQTISNISPATKAR